MAYNQEAVNSVVSYLKKRGIVNPFVIKGVLGTIAKESGFVPRSENTNYSKQSNAYIRTIFKKRIADISEAELTELKKDPIKFANHVYGGWMGNTTYGDGYKYRGRGFNQLTGKSNYKSYGDQLGRDLVGNPDLVNDPTIASEVVGAYFSNAFSNKILLNEFGLTNINDVKDITTGVKTAIRANAGPKVSLTSSFMIENIKRATEALKDFGGDILETVKKNKGTTMMIVVLISLVITGVVVYNSNT